MPNTEILLGQVLRTIREKQIRYVGITATDARDPIFLAHLIKQYCPDVQILLNAADTIYLHSHARYLHGSLVASTYPLAPTEQLWAPPYTPNDSPYRYTAFSNPSYLGIYNAFIFALRLTNNEYTITGSTVSLNPCKSVIPQPIAYGPPFCTHPELQPSVWISRIGPSGIFTVATYSVDDSKREAMLTLRTDHTQTKQWLFNGRPTAVTQALGLAWAAGGTYLLLGILVRARWTKCERASKTESVRASNTARWFRASKTTLVLGRKLVIKRRLPKHNFHSLERICRFGLAVPTAAVLLLYAALLTPSALFYSGGAPLLQCLLSALQVLWSAALVVSLLIAATIELVRAFKRDPESTSPTDLPFRKNPRRLPLLTIGIVAIVPFVVILWQLFAFAFHPERYAMWVNNTVDVWNGVSLMPPIQLVAIGLITLTQATRHQTKLATKRFAAMPSNATSRPTSPRHQQLRLLFPIWDRIRPIAGKPRGYTDRMPAHVSATLSLAIIAPCAWLLYACLSMPSADFFYHPINLIFLSYGIVAFYWTIRLCKFVTLTRRLDKELNEIERLQNWERSFADSQVQLPGLSYLLSGKAPVGSERLKRLLQVKDELVQNGQSANLRDLDNKILAIEWAMYIGQFFRHIHTVIRSLIIAAICLFFAAHTYPYNTQPILRFTASFIIISLAAVLALGYIQFDRNPVISALVGSKPNKLEFNWSFAQHVLPAAGAALIAVLSSAAPEMWHWTRDLLESIVSPK